MRLVKCASCGKRKRARLFAYRDYSEKSNTVTNKVGMCKACQKKLKMPSATLAQKSLKVESNELFLMIARALIETKGSLRKVA